MIELDERGTVCPAPIIALGNAAARQSSRPLEIALLADDPAAAYDVPAWCRMRGAQLADVSDLPDGTGTRYVVVVI